MDSNQRKLTLADLQSAPFSHSGIYPFRLSRRGSMRNPAGPDKENLVRVCKYFQPCHGIARLKKTSILADGRCEPTQPPIYGVMGDQRIGILMSKRLQGCRFHRHPNAFPDPTQSRCRENDYTNLHLQPTLDRAFDYLPLSPPGW